MAIRAAKLKGPARIYGLLLLLYPPGFRHRFGPEMLQVFQSTYAGNVGFAPHLPFWLWTLNDLTRSLPGEWRQALTGTDKIQFLVRRWADSLIVPLVVAGSLLVAGDLGMAPGAHPCGEAWNLASMATTCAVVALGLGMLGILSGLVAARNSRGEGTWIKLSL